MDTARLHQAAPSSPICHFNICDANMYHMKKASVRDLRYAFPKIERALRAGEEIQIAKRGRVIARLVPEHPTADRPDFLARLKKIYGERTLPISGAELISRERDER